MSIDRPWSKGPWEWVWFAGTQELNTADGSSWIVRNGSSSGTVSTPENAQLIALAPEMAEAIMRAFETEWADDFEAELRSVYYKIREIGKEL